MKTKSIYMNRVTQKEAWEKLQRMTLFKQVAYYLYIDGEYSGMVYCENNEWVWSF